MLKPAPYSVGCPRSLDPMLQARVVLGRSLYGSVPWSAGGTGGGRKAGPPAAESEGAALRAIKEQRARHRPAPPTTAALTLTGRGAG